MFYLKYAKRKVSIELITLQAKIILGIKRVEWIKILYDIIIRRALVVIKYNFT